METCELPSPCAQYLFVDSLDFLVKRMEILVDSKAHLHLFLIGVTHCLIKFDT